MLSAAMLSAPLSALQPVPCGLRPTLGARSCTLPAVRRAAVPQAASRPAVYFIETAQETQKRNEAAASTVAVTFSVVRQVPFGQQLAVVGSAECLGAWELSQAPLMSWSEGDVWQATLELPAGAAVEYKFVQQIPDQPPVWETSDNRTLLVDPAKALLHCEWDAPLATSWPGMLEQQAGADSAGDDDEESLPEDYAPAPAFMPAVTLSQFADAVKQSLGTADKKAEGHAAAAVAAAEIIADGGSTAARPAAPAVTAAASAQSPMAAPKAPTSPSGPPAGASLNSVVTAPRTSMPSSVKSAAAQVLAAGSDAMAVPAASQARGRGAVMAPAAPARKVNSNAFKSFGKAAGALAVTVAAGAVLSALAIDITDVALMGAITAGGMAAMSTPSASGRKAGSSLKKSDRGVAAQASVGEAETEEAAESEAEGTVVIGNKASAPAVILAAGVLTAVEAGRRALTPPPPPVQK